MPTLVPSSGSFPDPDHTLHNLGRPFVRRMSTLHPAMDHDIDSDSVRSDIGSEGAPTPEPSPHSFVSTAVSSPASSPSLASTPLPADSATGSASTSAATNSTLPSVDNEPFALLTHPAIVYASNRLSDPAYTALFHTVNVFDFDQTLFQSPLPNPALWDPSFVGILTSWNYCGTGWWHNPGTLELGPEVESTCWAGWWNEDIVKNVKESSSDPGCLTILLTGRNGPTFGNKLVQMVQAKGLDFDLIATKPTTVALMDTLPNKKSKGPQKSPEQYLKVHTFNTKHDFLYNVLYEYPAIRSMHLWDDRPCQVAKFRQAGQEWLDKKMIDHFEMTVVQEPLQYMDPDRETALVLAMVEANNHQVDLEAAGGPFLVPGTGAAPRTRPELKDRGIWNPYETYIPYPRRKIEVAKIVRYTGVMFSAAVQSFLHTFGSQGASGRDFNGWVDRPVKLRDQDLSKWVVPDDLHVTLCLGSMSETLQEQTGPLGSTVLVEIEAVGELESRIWGLKVKEFQTDSAREDNLYIVAPNGKIYSNLDELQSAYALQPSPPTANETSEADSLTPTHDSYKRVDLAKLGHVILKRDGTPHITMAYDRLNGTRAVDAGGIEDWEALSTIISKERKSVPGRIVLVGTLGEKQLVGVKARKQQPALKAEVSIAQVIKSLTFEQELPGKELGERIRLVKEEMEKLSIENRSSNEERIANIAQEVCDRAESMKAADLAHNATTSSTNAAV